MRSPPLTRLFNRSTNQNRKNFELALLKSGLKKLTKSDRNPKLSQRQNILFKCHENEKSHPPWTVSLPPVIPRNVRNRLKETSHPRTHDTCRRDVVTVLSVTKAPLQERDCVGLRLPHYQGPTPLHVTLASP